MEITLNKHVQAELEYLVELHRAHGAPNQHDSVESLVAYVLAAVADGSRRPGSCERSMLDMMGLVADCDEHHQYRSTYGKIEPARED
ncbi:TPA: hypothetical protein RUZ02_003457 [Vibrio cholerae]|nr:hypothetical protein [Vibrio cholerae]